MTNESAKARPVSASIDVLPETGSRSVDLIEGADYVILIASKHASDSLIDAAARIAKGADK